MMGSIPWFQKSCRPVVRRQGPPRLADEGMKNSAQSILAAETKEVTTMMMGSKHDHFGHAQRRPEP